MASIFRFLDWIGSGDPLTPENIGISLMYDTMNRDIDDDFGEFSESGLCEMDNCTNESDENHFVSDADLIRRFKELLEDGIITQDEFEHKKRQLLGI